MTLTVSRVPPLKLYVPNHDAKIRALLHFRSPEPAAVNSKNGKDKAEDRDEFENGDG